jgi:hypothetical protein
MYISGTYYFIKKSIGISILLDENRVRGQEEDVKYSEIMHNNDHIISINPYSIVRLLKDHHTTVWEKEIDIQQQEFLLNL